MIREGKHNLFRDLQGLLTAQGDVRPPQIVAANHFDLGLLAHPHYRSTERVLGAGFQEGNQGTDLGCDQNESGVLEVFHTLGNIKVGPLGCVHNPALLPMDKEASAASREQQEGHVVAQSVGILSVAV